MLFQTWFYVLDNVCLTLVFPIIIHPWPLAFWICLCEFGVESILYIGALEFSLLFLLVFSLDFALGCCQGFQLFHSRPLWKNVNVEELLWFEMNILSQMPNYFCSLPYPHTQRIFDISLHHYNIVIEINCLPMVNLGVELWTLFASTMRS